MINLAIYSTSVSFVPQRSIGGFTANVTIEEVGTDELMITKHPVQSGTYLTDHAYLQPARLEIRAAWGQTDGVPVTEIYNRLLDLQASREPFAVITGKRKYNDMLFVSLTQTFPRAGNVCLIHKLP